MSEWQIQVQGFDTEGKPPTILPGGQPSGSPTVTDVEKLLDGLCAFAAVAAAKLNTIEAAPSELTLEGHVAIQVTAGVPVLQFGVEAGISVSMTWTFETHEVVITPRGRKTDEG